MQFIATALAVPAGLLSYKMPVYLARFFHIDDYLGGLWIYVMAGEVPTQILFIAAYMAAGFAAWAVPLGLLLAVVHPGTARAIWRMPAAPLSMLLRPLWLRILTRYDAAEADLLERRQIKALYRSDFKDEHSSFGRFYSYYKGLDDAGFIPRKPFTAADDPFEDAVALLGLPSGFTQQNLTTRYRMLIKQVHPDIAGPNDMARRLTDALDIIKAREGWT